MVDIKVNNLFIYFTEQIDVESGCSNPIKFDSDSKEVFSSFPYVDG
jgi:hypothetical protein